jgi:predicted RNase H-like HicB family nuclease
MKQLREETVESELNFFTVVLKKSAGVWVSLCLENGIVGQGATEAEAIAKLKQAIESWQVGVETEPDVYQAPISIKELHEFLALETVNPSSEAYELRAVYA